MNEVPPEITSPEDPRGPGRPRNPSIDEAVLRVALKQIGEVGYARMTLDAVAAEAGVTKPAIYRRWSGKEDLATAALAKLRVENKPSETDDIRRDMTEVLRAVLVALRALNGFSMLGTILAEERHMPEFMRLFRERVVHPRRDMLRGVIERGIAAGQIRPDVDINAVSNMLIGSFMALYLETGEIPDNWPDRVINAAWSGMSAR